MNQMTDPHNSLVSLQFAFSAGVIQSQPGKIDPSLNVLMDFPTDDPKVARMTYFKVRDGQVIGSLSAFLADPIDGVPCFDVGYAVAEGFRGQGIATAIVEGAIAEMRHGYGRAGIKTFYIEAVVGAHNIASQHVSSKTISSNPAAVTDELSGQPAYHYLKKIET